MVLVEATNAVLHSSEDGQGANGNPDSYFCDAFVRMPEWACAVTAV